MITTWDERFSAACCTEMTFELALWHATRILVRSEQADEVILMLYERDIRGLCSYELHYDGLLPQDALEIRQILAFFSKRWDWELGIDPEAAALAKFEEAEKACRETNEIFRKRARGEFLFSPRVESVLYASSRQIARILGDLPALSDLKPHFGPGATTLIKKREASARRKLAEPFTCSEALLPYAKRILQEFPGWLASRGETPDPVKGEGKLSFVRKKATIHRGIVVEPGMNSFMQLGIGDYIARGLLPWGVDIRDQTPNQRMAKEGSITGGLATLDLSSASDMIAYLFVWDQLPVDWAAFLDIFRTPVVNYRGKRGVRKTFRLEKYSSMGNGFTFPLETLLFYTLAFACTREVEGDLSKVRAYGDDIIIPVEADSLLREVLACVGFTVNHTKSFATGAFRESCGKDYISGYDIRPFYQKGPFTPRTLTTLHNYYVRREDAESASLVRSWIPKRFWRFGPDGYGDGHLVGDHRKTRSAKHLRDGWAGYVFSTIVARPRRSFWSSRADRALPLYLQYLKGAEVLAQVNPRLKGAGYLRTLALWDKDLAIGPPSFGYDRGELWVTLPGVEEYKRVNVYTLAT